MHPETIRIRKYMQRKIWRFLMQRRLMWWGRQPVGVSDRKMVDVVKRLEDGLFRSAKTMEEYLNFETLERRLQVLVKRFSSSYRNQQLSPIGAMIPTPGRLSGGLRLMAKSMPVSRYHQRPVSQGEKCEQDAEMKDFPQSTERNEAIGESSHDGLCDSMRLCLIGDRSQDDERLALYLASKLEAHHIQ